MIPVYAFGALKSSFLDFKKINMKISYSNTTKSYYLMNICQNCQAKQGEFFYLTK
ncbi:hypothetical protein FORC46_p0023 (plasmid) [Campylobacter jejuni]|nr:hypothetical protein FORC46_p0023 [Campylobacter jejuni]